MFESTYKNWNQLKGSIPKVKKGFESTYKELK